MEIDRMSMISEQVRRLRKEAKFHKDKGIYLYALLKEAADTIESLSAKLADMERSAEDCGGGWIYCGDGNNMPKEDGFYLVTLTHRITDIADMLIHKAFFNEKRNAFMDYGSAVIAWKPLPKPYHEP